jgi:hypothetical protein
MIRGDHIIRFLYIYSELCIVTIFVPRYSGVTRKKMLGGSTPFRPSLGRLTSVSTAGSHFLTEAQTSVEGAQPPLAPSGDVTASISQL